MTGSWRIASAQRSKKNRPLCSRLPSSPRIAPFSRERISCQPAFRLPGALFAVFQRTPSLQAGSTGFSFYIGGGFYPAIRWDYVWLTEDFRNFTRRPRPAFSLAYNF